MFYLHYIKLVYHLELLELQLFEVSTSPGLNELRTFVIYETSGNFSTITKTSFHEIDKNSWLYEDGAC